VSVTSPGGGITTNTPATRVVVYYNSGVGSGYPECDNHPEWTDMACRSQFGGQAASGPELPVTTTTYHMFGQPRVATESTAAGVQRTTTITYDTAARPSTVAITVAAGLGSAVPTTRHIYDQASGQETHTQSLDATSAVTAEIVRQYDLLGRLTSYTDADLNVSTMTYDILSRPASTNDGRGTRTYTYDGGTERRGALTGVLDSQGGSFSGTYDADGKLATETWPNGVTVNATTDEAGTPTSVAYTMPTCGQPDCTLYADSIVPAAGGQWQRHSSTLSTQTYGYDSAGRLTSVADVVLGQCTTRTYGFDGESNRISRTTYAPVAGGACQTTTGSANTLAYDTADRVTGTGYSYDALGRTTSMPTNGIPVRNATTTRVGYYANDMASVITVQTVPLTQNVNQKSYALDVVNNRFRSSTDVASNVTQTNHYSFDGDSPTWTDEGSGAVSRQIAGVGGAAARYTTSAGVQMLISNLHGDFVASMAAGSGTLSSTNEYTEYGQARGGYLGAVRYGWLGNAQRAADTPGGVVLMGARVYSPMTGRFLSVDSVSGGSCNPYDYACGDPINRTDIGGTSLAPPQGGSSIPDICLLHLHNPRVSGSRTYWFSSYTVLFTYPWRQVTMTEWMNKVADAASVVSRFTIANIKAVYIRERDVFHEECSCRVTAKTGTLYKVAYRYYSYMTWDTQGRTDLRIVLVGWTATEYLPFIPMYYYGDYRQSGSYWTYG
jgi:RHS repeat-associated protein